MNTTNKAEFREFINDRITRLRLQLGISERRMSEELGKSPSYIRNITDPDSEVLPSAGMLWNICEYLGISLKEFFDNEQENPIVHREILNEIDRLFEKDETRLFTLRNYLRELEPEEVRVMMNMLQKIRKMRL